MKKSYMNIHNVLTEGFFEKIRRTLGLSTKQEKILRKDKKLMKLIKDLNYEVSEFEKHAQDMFKDLGIKRKVNIKKYQVKDFL